jgi:Transposase DDE domain
MKTNHEATLTSILLQILPLVCYAAQTVFLLVLFPTWLVIPGRINFSNLARFSKLSEKTFRNWFVKAMEWLKLALSLVKFLQDRGLVGKEFILGIDTSFCDKSGKKTPGIANFWNSKISKAIPGLEICAATLIDLEYRQPIHLHSCQTPASLPEGQTRVDHYLTHAKYVIAGLTVGIKNQVKAVVGDSFYTKKNFIDGIAELKLHFVGKMRSDANLRYLYDGGKTGKPGRPRVYDGKLDFSDLSRFDIIVEKDKPTLYTLMVNSVCLKRNIRIVILLHGKEKDRHEILFSTNTAMSAEEVVKAYRARFEMEFVFRDGKSFSGLMDSQSRQKDAIEFHWNAALMVVNLVRAAQLQRHGAPPTGFVFSMEDEKRRAYNSFFAERIIRMLPLNETIEKCLALIKNALNIGVKAA